MSPDAQKLKRSNNERTEWFDLNDSNLTLSDYGFTPKNAKADEPAVLALLLPGNYLFFCFCTI